VRAHARHAVAVAFLAFGGLLLFGHTSGSAAADVPSPLFVIDTYSGSTHVVRHSTVGLPTSIDVDGDGAADVSVTLSLVDAGGLADPGNLTAAVGADLTITSPAVLGAQQAMPPLKIVVTMALVDPTTLHTTQQLRFGYDTGTGGSIPAHFEASLTGLAQGFNPLHATVDTAGGLLGIATNPNQPPTYTGPLTLLAGVGTPGAVNTDVAARYLPFPGSVGIDYATDADGMHLHYAQPPDSVTRLHADITGTSADGSGWNATADIDRMPNDLTADIAVGDGQGRVRLSHGPGDDTDARVALTSHDAHGGLLVARSAVAGLPDSVTATWSLCPADAPAGCVPGATFDSDGDVAGLDLQARNFVGSPTLFALAQPSEQQYLAFQSATSGTSRETALSGHLEHLSHADLTPTPDGFAAHVRVGDGKSPLGVYYRSDERGAPTAGPLLAADAHVAPLPAAIGFQLHAATTDQPMEAVVDTSAPAEITAHALLSEGPADRCADAETLCADLALHHTPVHADVRLGRSEDAGPAGVDVDTTRAAGAPAPDLVADLTAGAGALDVPLLGSTPLYGHLEIRQLPEHIRVRYEVADDVGLESAEFHACDWDFSADQPGCTGAPGTIGEIDFALRNFAPTDRPADLPPPDPTADQFASLAARQAAGGPLRFEAAGRVRQLSEADLRLVDGIVGVRAVTSGGNFAARADIDTSALALTAHAALTPLPSRVDFCLRPGGTAAGTATGGGFTAACETADPFHEAPAPDREPMTFAVDASDTFQLAADAHAVDRATGEAWTGSVAMPVAPRSLTVNVRPAVTCAAGASDCNPLPTRADYAVPADSPDLSMTVTAAKTTGDAQCGDPRADAVASCLSATLEHLPVTASMCFDPGAAHRCDPDANLVVTTGDPTGGADANFDITQLQLSSVAPDPDTGAQRALVASGSLIGVPHRITATMNSAGLVAHADGSGLGEVKVTVRNYIAPDIADLTVPAQRAGLAAPQSSIAVFTRGNRMTATADLHNVTDAGFTPSLAEDGTPLPTQRVVAGFAAGQTVRIYADLVDDDGKRLVADVTIEHNPASLSVCFRGVEAADTPTAVHPTWCDQAASRPTQVGAVAVVQDHADSAADIHAFLRQSDYGGAATLSGVLDATGLPAVLHATFGDGQYEGSGLTTSGAPAGIGSLRFDVANFDLPAAETGYTATPLPDFADGAASAPFPAPALTGSYLSLVATDSAFQTRGELGSAGAHVQHVLYSDQPCSEPGGRADYPFYPRTKDTTYTCARVDFTKDSDTATPLHLYANLTGAGAHITLDHAGLTDVPDWFQATIAQTPTLNPDTSLRRRCGWQGASASQEANNGDGNCMPPLLRVDAADQAMEAVIYGRLSYASSASRGAAELAALASTVPDQPMQDSSGDAIDLGADPAAGWNADSGVRLRVGSFPAPGGGTDTAVIAGLRLAVHESLTVDQLQTYSDAGTVAVDDGGGDCDRIACLPGPDPLAVQPQARCLPEDCPNPPDGGGTTPPPSIYDMLDLRAHFVARDRNALGLPWGTPVASLGNLEALVTTFDEDRDPITSIEAQNVQDGSSGTDLPGEFGIDLQQRGAISGAAGFRHDKISYHVALTTSNYFQMHVRANLGTGTVGAYDAVLQDVGPTPNTGADGWCNVDPALDFCTQETVDLEIVKGPQQLHFEPPDGPSDSTITYADFHIRQISLVVSLRNTSYVRAVVNLNGPQNGVEVSGNGTVPAHGTISFDHFDVDVAPADPGPTTTDVYLHLRSTLDVSFSSDATDLTVAQNLLHVTGSVTSGTATVGPIDLTVPETGGLHVFVDVPGPENGYVDYAAESDHPAPLAETWNQCRDADFDQPGNSYHLPTDGPLDHIVEPIHDSRISVTDSTGGITLKNFAIGKLADAMCALSTAVDLADAGYPSDPVAYPLHPVAGLAADHFGTVAPAAASQPAPPDDGTTHQPASVPDTTAPASALVTVPAAPDGALGFFRRQPLAVLLAADDAGGSGIATVYYRLDGGDPTPYAAPVPVPAGQHTLSWYAVDAAGNTEAAHTRQFRVDADAPSLTVTAPPAGAGGWYRTSPVISVAVTDGGSGPGACYTSLDGAPFIAAAGTQTVTVPDGLHTLVSYAVDAAGNRSATDVRTIRVDATGPVTELRADPPAPMVGGWWRLHPLVHLTAADSGSGVQAIEYSVDGGTWLPYADPFAVDEGTHVVRARATDVAGNVGSVVSATFRVDSTGPVATATTATPSIWLPLLGPAQLHWTVSDNLARTVHVRLMVLTRTGDVAAVLDGGQVAVTPGTVTSGSTAWNGKDGTLTGLLPLGSYTYEVVATDEAGNVSQSGRSMPVLVRLL
jgi:hypothetical protein